VLDPYDVRMGQPGSVTPAVLAGQALTLGIDWGAQVYALLPRPYLARLDEALRTHDVYVQDVYEATGGIGDQKRVNVNIGRDHTAPVTPAAPTGPAPTVWLGGDVSALWWGVPVLVSYGRLRDAKTLPAASAPWVLDSRGFTELSRHGRWTIPAEQYAADVRRYADEIGHLQWVAPQDWPASAAMLARTGLTEADHQARTVASVVQLRGMLPGQDVLPVLTGTDAAGYARMIGMYAAVGIDVTAELVGVGALVGRTPAETADIIRTLHAAGVRRMHGFGVKGRALDLIGPLLESVDSAAWSLEARHGAGRCTHGLAKHERNCPAAAKAWGAGQTRRAEAAAAHGVQEMLPFGQAA
jgi:hypothetical protein